ncbi:GNAT family N-acetyltransferase [Rhabdonatronobacter sediminivivens]
MSAPAPAPLMAALEATWPPAARMPVGAFMLRDGAGGGKRVSAAVAMAEATEADIAAAEAAMRARGEQPLFMIRAGDGALDDALAARGYAQIDTTLFYAAPVGILARKPAPITLFPIWPPLQIIRDIWTERGIGAARQAVMARAAAPKAALIARVADRAAGAAFVACHGDIAMLHAVEVLPNLRRQGGARNLVTGAAWWAQEQGMRWLALAVTRDNAAARAVYDGLGMMVCGGYHYRMLAAPGAAG